MKVFNPTSFSVNTSFFHFSRKMFVALNCSFFSWNLAAIRVKQYCKALLIKRDIWMQPLAAGVAHLSTHQNSPLSVKEHTFLEQFSVQLGSLGAWKLHWELHVNIEEGGNTSYKTNHYLHIYFAFRGVKTSNCEFDIDRNDVTISTFNIKGGIEDPPYHVWPACQEGEKKHTQYITEQRVNITSSNLELQPIKRHHGNWDT